MTYPDGRHSVPAPRTTGADRDHMRDYLTREGFDAPRAGHIPPPRSGEAGPARPGRSEWMTPDSTYSPAAQQAQEAFRTHRGQTGRPYGSMPDAETLARQAEADRADRAGLPFLARGRAVDRLVTLSASHTGHAADRVRTRDDVCEYVPVQFSMDLGNSSYPVSVASKMSHSDEENASLPRLLDSMTRYVDSTAAAARGDGWRYDPRTAVVTGTGVANRSEHRDPAMTYIGVGVSSLDTPEMPWRQMQPNVERNSGLKQRSQGYLYLADGTFMTFVRSALSGPEAGQAKITANRTVHSSRYQVQRNFELWNTCDLPTQQIWQALVELHDALTAAISQ